MLTRLIMQHSTRLLILLVFVRFTFLSGCGADDDLGGLGDAGPSPDAYTAGDIADELARIPGVTAVTEQPTSQDGYRFFYFFIEQPVDHDDPDGPRFAQLVSLLHRDYAAPVILATTGYDHYVGDYRMEPTVLLDANQLVIEHRFFGSSRPDPDDWDRLRIRQGAGDHHRVREALAHLYPAAWVSTGASKGGMTSIYHRRFYPDDVVATIAYVAPLSFGAPDARYQPFFDTVGDADCRQRLHEFQREALVRRASLEVLAAELAAEQGYTFDIVGGLEVAVEADVAGFEWSFWQYMHADWCPLIPEPIEGDVAYFDFLNLLGGVSSMSDAGIMRFMPYYFQAEVELGYPGYHAAYLDDLLLYQDVPMADIYPPGYDRAYAPEAMQDIDNWVQTEGERLLFVYGENDPWTAGAFELGGAQDSYRFTAPQDNHGAGILDLAEADREVALTALAAWTGVSPQVPASAARTAMRAERERLLPPRVPLLP